MKTLLKLISICLLLYRYCICVDFNCTLETFLRKSIQQQIKFPSLPKGQLPSEMDNSSANSDKESSNPETEDTTSSNIFLNRRAAKRKTLSKNSKSCKCNAEDVVNESVIIKDRATVLSKALLPVSKDDDGSSASSVNTIPIITAEDESATLLPTYLPIDRVENELNRTEFQMMFDVKDICPFFKDAPELDMVKMADVWQLVRYKSQEKLQCFKIYINKTTFQNRQYYEQKFTSFNGTINWQECFLELTSAGKAKEVKRHFLQGNINNRGVLENIVLSQVDENDTKIITLLDQAPDQWLVTKDLLLMRDCENGDVIIFARVPNIPYKIEMEEALLNFGEDGMDGFISCADNSENNDVTYIKTRYHILS